MDALTLALGLGLLIAVGIAVFLFMQLARTRSDLGEQATSLDALSRERDEALAKAREQARELKSAYGEQIQELESEKEVLSEATARLRKLVVVDELTSLSNRMHFDQVLPHEIKRALREEKPLSIILGRFDWADAYRESYSQERFDSAMRKIAEEVRSIFRRAGDLPARYDDSAFGIIFTSDGDIAVRFAERLRKAIWNIPIPHDASEVADRVTFSIGVATIEPNKVHDPGQFRQAAENAVQVAIDNGGNQVEEYRKPSEPSPV